MLSLKELRVLWEQFGDTPIDDADNTEESFLHFPADTYRFDIWTWFEDENPLFIIHKEMYGE